MGAAMECNMLSFTTIRPLSEAKRIRMGLPPLPSNLLRLVQRAAHAQSTVNTAKSNAESTAKSNAIATPRSALGP